MIQKGIHLGLDEGVYRADPAVSVSDVKPMLISPRHFFEKKFGSKKRTPPTPAQITGTLVHMAILEPEKFKAKVHTLPDDAPKRPTKAQLEAAKPSTATLEAIQFWKVWEEQHPGAQIIERDQMAQVCGMRDAVFGHKIAAEYLTECATEVSVFGEASGGLRIKGRIDCVPKAPKLVDIKTVGLGGARPDEFSRSLWDWRYDMQVAYYLDLYNSNFDEWDDHKKKTDFVFVCVEKEEPYAVCLYKVSRRVIDRGRRDYLALLQKVVACQKANEWPGYSDAEGEIDLPAWADRANPSP